MTPRRANIVVAIVTGVVLAAALAACWVVPYRLATTGARSFYAFVFIGDEGFYAARVQPLVRGATATNPVNGVCDPRMVSVFFLEDLLRAVITVTGVDVIVFVWAWRWVLPAALLGLMVALARAAVARRRRPWSAALRYAAAAAGFMLLYNLYDLLIVFPPLQGWLNRFPTSIEFCLSVAIAWAFVHFSNGPSAGRGIILALISAATVYLRPYAALGWAIAIPAAMIGLVVTKRVALRVALVALAAVLLATAPWVGIALWNNRFPTQQEIVARYFNPPLYQVNPYWKLCLAMAVVFLLAALWVRKQHRPFLLACGASMVALPLVCGLFCFARELVFDRFCVFYLVVLAAAGLLLLDRASQSWRGQQGWLAARRWTIALSAVAVIGACRLAAANWHYDFSKYPQGPYASMADELRYLPAYRWCREHTPESALFLFDDGSDWHDGTFARDGLQLANMLAQGDLFQIVARRRRVFSERLFCNSLSDEDCTALKVLHRATFGVVYKDAKGPLAALERFRPSHVFVRKERSGQRGLLPRLGAMSRTVYSDDVCEVWEIAYDAGAGREQDAAGR
ncbi:MAG: hypothetical protein NTW87_25535 [Planctomycetota bacterium]|nr:hypothetical protein [Planctomycetota bacterium]